MRKNLKSGGTGRTAAFTLVELIMVLAIMSMLLSMSVAAFSSMLQSKGMEGAKKTISSALFGARLKAIRDKRQVTVALAAEAGTDSGFVLDNSMRSQRTYVIQRMVKGYEDVDSIDANARKSWTAGSTYKPVSGASGSLYWIYVAGGQGSGSIAKIAGNDTWYIDVEGSWKRPPGNNSMICIIKTKPDSEPPIPEQYKVTSDMALGSWEALPKFIQVDGTAFPITFRPDGSAAFPRDFAKIRLRDMRVDENWTWRMIVERGAGRCQSMLIQPGDSDAKVNLD